MKTGNENDVLKHLQEVCGQFISLKELDSRYFIKTVLEGKNSLFESYWRNIWANLVLTGSIKLKTKGDTIFELVDEGEIIKLMNARDIADTTALKNRRKLKQPEADKLYSILIDDLMLNGLVELVEFKSIIELEMHFDERFGDKEPTQTELNAFIKQQLGLEKIKIKSKKGNYHLAKLIEMPLEIAVELKYGKTAKIVEPQTEDEKVFVKILSLEEMEKIRILEKRKNFFQQEQQKNEKALRELEEESEWLNKIVDFAKEREKFSTGEVIKDVLKLEPDEFGRIHHRVNKIIKQLKMQQETHKTASGKKFTVYKWPEIKKPDKIEEPYTIEEPSYEIQDVPPFEFEKDMLKIDPLPSQQADEESVFIFKVNRACSEYGIVYEELIKAFEKHGVSSLDYPLKDLAILAEKEPSSFKEIVEFALKEPKIEEPKQTQAPKQTPSEEPKLEPKAKVEIVKEPEPVKEEIPDHLAYDFRQIEEVCLRLSLGGKFPRKYLFPEDSDVDWQRNVLKYLQYNNLIEVEGEKFQTKYKAISGQLEKLLSHEMILEIATSYNRPAYIQEKFKIEPTPKPELKIESIEIRKSETAIVPELISELPENSEQIRVIAGDIEEMFKVMGDLAKRVVDLERDIKILKGK